MYNDGKNNYEFLLMKYIQHFRGLMKTLLTKFSALIFILVLAVASAYATNNDDARIRKELPRLLGSSNQGTEFYMTFHPCWETAGKADGCKIYITSAVATRVTIEIPGKEIYIQKTTLPNDIIEISLDPGIAQCYRKTDREPPQPQRVFKGYGIIVTADDPIVCYGVTRYQYTSDGYLAIPKSGLGKSYICASYNDPCQDNGNQYLSSFTSIVGVYNKTDVKVKLGGRFSNYTPGANPLKTGDRRNERLDRGDVWLIGTMGDYSDLTGTTVEANKQVAVISGSFCAYIPIQMSACDFTSEQDLPMETWGYKYHVTRIIKRLKASIIRVFASEPNTVIYRDGNEWSLVKGVGGPEGTGYVERRAVTEGDALRPVTVSAKNRIAVEQYNSGISDDGIDSDPFQIALTPLEQYQTGFVWCTPGVLGGSSFKDNFLNLCYKSTEDGQIPDDIEFGKVSNGVINWRKLSTVIGNPGQEFVDETVTDKRKYRSLTITLEDPAGVYSLRSAEGMAGYGYGFDWCDSYGYPVSVALADLSKPDIWAPIPTYTIDCMGNVDGRVIEQPENDESLRSNMADLRLVKGESYNFTDLVYDEANFFPGETYIMDWSLKVIDIESDAKAVLAFMDRAGNDTTITIEYNRTKFSIKNRIENWGLKAYNDPAEFRDFKLINESLKPVVVDSILLLSTEKGRKWAYNGFKLDPAIYKANGGVLPGYTIQPGEELNFRVSFDPQTVAAEIIGGKNQFLDSIGIKAYWSNDVNSYCYFKYRAAVKSVTGSPCITVDRLDFGQVTVNNTKSLPFTIFNHGTAELTITGYVLPAGAPDDIYVSNDLGPVTPNNPIRIASGASAGFSVRFKPNDVKQFPDQIEFISDADVTCSSHDPILELTGEGIKPGIELVGYDWPRLRVHLPVYDDPTNPYGNKMFPYTTKAGGKTTSMTVSNTGSQEFTITSATIKNGVNPEFFIMDFNDDGIMDGPISDNLYLLIGKKVLPQELNTYPVYYDPKAIGDHTVTVVIKGEKDGYQVEGECTFRGTGIYPVGNTFDYMFTKNLPNQTAIVDPANKGYDETIQFTANNWGDFADDLTIYGVNLVNAEGNAISQVIGTPGDRLFSYDKNAITFPVVLKPGATFSFPAKYYATASSPNLGNDPYVAHVVFVTDADVTAHTSEWSGKSVSQGAIAKGFSITTCIKYEEYGVAKITNTADGTLDITSMFIRYNSVDNGAFTIVDPSPFKLAAGASKDIQVLFKNDVPGVTGADIVFVTSISAAAEVKAAIEGTTFSYPRTTTGKINGSKHDATQAYQIGFSKDPRGNATNKFTYTVEIDATSINMDEVNKETNFYVDVVYDRNFLGADFDEVKKQVKVDLGLGLNASDYVITDVKEEKLDAQFSKIAITIRNVSGQPITSKGIIELVKLNFSVFLNETTIDLKSLAERTTKIEHTVTTNETCLPLTTVSIPFAVLQEVCVQNMRLIVQNQSQFSLKDVNPNPVGANGADISYSLGFDCNTEITIFNSAGSAIAKPVDGKQTAGAHSVAIPINELASGVYFIELKAGPYVGTTRLVITK